MENEFSANFSKNLKDLIQKDGRSPSTIAKLAGVNKSTVHNWINGVKPSGLKSIESLARVFGITPFELFGIQPLSVEVRISGDAKGLYEIRVEKKTL